MAVSRSLLGVLVLCACVVIPNPGFKITQDDSAGDTSEGSGSGSDDSAGTPSTSEATTAVDPCAGISEVEKVDMNCLYEADCDELYSRCGNTYYRCGTGEDWEASKNTCQRRCFRLAVLDEEANAAIRDYLHNELGETQEAKYWIGGHREDDAWRWSDGSPMPGIGQGGWGMEAPDPLAGRDCAVLTVPESGDPQWFDLGCNVFHQAICEGS